MNKLVNGIHTSEKTHRKGLYESFYFRGVHEDQQRSFWLKHNFLMPRGGEIVRFECTVVAWGAPEKEPHTVKYVETISAAEFQQKRIAWGEQWTGLNHRFKDDGGGWVIGPDRLEGSLPGVPKTFWNFSLQLAGETYYHFDPLSFYDGAFPKKKILTVNNHVNFEGLLSGPWGEWDGRWIGMNGHNWGTEHAYKYAYGDCNLFREDPTAYFDGFSAKIRLGGLLTSPYLSCASLKVRGQWYHFNRVLSSYRHKVELLEERRWKVVFVDREYRLEVSIDGASLPKGWVHLQYDHPSGRVSTVHNTKYASGRLELQTRSGRTLEILTSEYFELESLLKK